MDALLESRFAPELLRILITGSVFFLGMVAGWLWGKWRRHRQLRLAERGDAREVLTIEKILLDPRADGAEVMRIRSCGRDPIDHVFPNGAARDEFQKRAGEARPGKPLISMEGKLGSYLLQELAIWVCGQVGEDDFHHDVWVMAPACESSTLNLGGHLSSTILLVRRDDLVVFRDWERCKSMLVEHRSHGERLITLQKMAEEFERQWAMVRERRSEGRRSGYEETMYILDLALDTRSADLPALPVPWDRFREIMP